MSEYKSLYYIFQKSQPFVRNEFHMGVERKEAHATLTLFAFTKQIGQSPVLMAPRKRPFENIVGKGENAGNQHFHLFQQCFLPHQRQVSSFNPLPNTPF